MLAHTGSHRLIKAPQWNYRLSLSGNCPLPRILYILLRNAQVTLHSQLLSPINLLFNFVC